MWRKNETVGAEEGRLTPEFRHHARAAAGVVEATSWTQQDLSEWGEEEKWE